MYKGSKSKIKDISIKIILIVSIGIILLLILKECTKIRCDICDEEATKVLDAVITYHLCDEHYDWFTGGSSSDSSLSPSKEYKKTKGANGAYRYRCLKKCDEDCTNGCKSCVRDGTKCKFEYKSSNSDIGWIGCPDCGDITHKEWFDWYENALKSK